MSNIPKLRFPEFTDAWEKCKLGEIATINPKSTLPQTFNYVDLESVVGTEMRSYKIEKLYSAPSRAQRLAKYGDIFYQTVRPYQKNNYLFELDDENYVFSTGYAQIRSKIYPYFLFTLIQNDRFVNEVLDNCTGTSYPAINATDLKNITIFISNNPIEQQKIGNLFKQLDRLITLHKRKWDDVILLKKALLQKMFPKNGSDFPALRFPEFTDAWEKCKLEKYLEVSNEKNINNKYSKQEVLSVSGEFGIINQIEFKGRSFAGASVEKYSVVDTGDIVYTKSPLQNNPYGIIKTNKGIAGIVSTLYAVYHPKKDTDPEFVQTYFDLHSRTNNYLAPLVNKGAKNDMKISSENALKGFVTFPKFSEQQKIGNLFKQLDRLITLHKRQHEHYQLLKKALLQQMFV